MSRADGLVCVFAAATPERIGRGAVDVIRSIAATADPGLAERLDRGTAPISTRTWPGTPGYLRSAHGPGWALVGDAGCFKDPLVAHGLTDALRDAELLARAIDVGLTNGNLVHQLAEYQSLRDHLSLPLLETADRIASHRWDEDEAEVLLRRISTATAEEVELLAGFDRPPSGGQLARQADRRPPLHHKLQGATS